MSTTQTHIADTICLIKTLIPMLYLLTNSIYDIDEHNKVKYLHTACFVYKMDCIIM